MEARSLSAALAVPGHDPSRPCRFAATTSLGNSFDGRDNRGKTSSGRPCRGGEKDSGGKEDRRRKKKTVHKVKCHTRNA